MMELGQAMKKADGDMEKAAKALGITKKKLHERIGKDPSLRALYYKMDPTDNSVDEVEQMTQEADKEIYDQQIASAMEENGKEIYRQGIEKFLEDDPEVLARFDVFKGIEQNIGLMFAQTTQFFQGKLVETLCSLAKMDKQLGERMGESGDPEEYAMFTRLRLQTMDMFGKYYDRNLSGLETMVKLTEQSEPKSKSKPGFKPLKDLQEVEGD